MCGYQNRFLYTFCIHVYYKNGTVENLYYLVMTVCGQKKGSVFDVTMGSYDRAEICELVGLYLFCSWERHFTAHFSAWWSWQAVLNYSHISIKLQADSNILASPEAGRGNCLPYVLAPPSLSCESGG